MRLVMLLIALLLASAPATADCLAVADDHALAIDPVALKALEPLGLDRAAIFNAMNEVSQIETSGCWAAPAGDFDGQIISVGTAQWNYGQQSLQPLLRLYRRRFLTQAAFDANLRDTMQKYGETIFSEGCLSVSHKTKSGARTGGMSAECHSFFKSLQVGSGGLDPELRTEFESLFNNLVMRQIQLDKFVDLIGRVRSDLMRLFPNSVPTPVQIQWAIDTKVQQETFPTNRSVASLRLETKTASAGVLKGKELAAVQWYEGLCNGFYQDGVRYDTQYNVKHWNQYIEGDHMSPGQVDLMGLTLLRSRTAGGEDGRWQALTFERRIKIVLGVGSVGGNTRTRARTT